MTRGTKVAPYRTTCCSALFQNSTVSTARVCRWSRPDAGLRPRARERSSVNLTTLRSRFRRQIHARGGGGPEPVRLRAVARHTCPQSDSNRHLADFKSAASANWAMGAFLGADATNRAE